MPSGFGIRPAIAPLTPQYNRSMTIALTMPPPSNLTLRVTPGEFAAIVLLC
ncbi:MAG: hypothetical protein JJU32_09360 [Phormidium sp. BM_Day4_Bin.17]|nr:hypothetical protein [Phormidium sp. BM_Day4_Bin.17]UCJ11720.1 MAG: hypothetical protein JWS08_18565 [Phormidium sp. PBR-2020]